MKNNSDLKLKKELDTVYIDSGGKKHLDYMEALCAEAQIRVLRERKLQIKKKIMEIVELIMQVFKSENWGVFYKNQPIQPLELQNGNSLYQVNQVDECEIEKAIKETLTKWEEPMQTNYLSSNQSKIDKTG